MEINNPGLAFNKTVFSELKRSLTGQANNDKVAFKNKTKELHKALFSLPLNDQMVSMFDVKSYISGDKRKLIQPEFTVAWPGLMMGIGYGHGAKTGADSKDHPFMTEVKTGFYFDFTTGLPVLPGSTVKGILRSFFPGRYKSNADLKQAVLERIVFILKVIKPETETLKWNEGPVKALENAIFEGFEMTKNENDKDKKCFFSSTEQDIFFDAFPCAGTTANVFETNTLQKVQNVYLGEDVLTPHHHPLKDPVPLKHLKILPGVKIKFQFLLNDKGGLSSDEKAKLFEYILLEFGAGARKGTGFGQFVPKTIVSNPFSENGFIEFDDFDSEGWDEEYESQKPKQPNNKQQKQHTIIEDDTWKDPQEIKKGVIVCGTIITALSGALKVLLHIKGKKIIVSLNGKGAESQVLDLVVNSTEGKPEKDNFNVRVTRKTP